MKLKDLPAAVVAAAAWLATLATATTALSSTRDQLRFIVQQQCVPHWLAANDPAPCVSVSLSGWSAESQGFAVLADQKGGAHYLLIPVGTISGIESPEILSSGALNYFDAAWQARGVLATSIHRPVPRNAIGMAVNQIRSRSQDQLHIHLSCLGQAVYEALQIKADQLGESWAPMSIAGWQYQVMRIPREQLGPVNPFELLADRLPGARDSMDQFTLLLAGMQFRDGPGFALLAGTHVPGAELLLDSTCAVVNAVP